MSYIVEAWGWLHSFNDAEVTATVEWDSDDPLTLRMVFETEAGSVPWVFARDLVRLAIICGDSGQGDIKFKIEAELLFMTLDSPFGTVTMRSPHIRFAEFLAATYRVVPIEDEDLTAQIDTELAELLEGK